MTLNKAREASKLLYKIEDVEDFIEVIESSETAPTDLLNNVLAICEAYKKDLITKIESL